MVLETQVSALTGRIRDKFNEITPQLAAITARLDALEAPKLAVFNCSASNLNTATTIIDLTVNGVLPSWATLNNNEVTLTAGEYLAIPRMGLTSNSARTNVGFSFAGESAHGGNYIRAQQGNNEAGDTPVFAVTGPVTSSLTSFTEANASGAVVLESAFSSFMILKVG